MKANVIGFLLLISVIVGTVFYTLSKDASTEVTLLPKASTLLIGEAGGEKSSFLHDPEVQKILQKKYDLALNNTKAGSIEMVSGQIKPTLDYLWPSSQVALEIYKEKHSNISVQSEIIFNSPIVFYSWDIVTDALIAQGIVEKVGETYYVTNTQKLIQLVIEGTKWSDIGVKQLFGKMTIISTDPTRSNSGNMFAGLLANLLHGDVVDLSSVDGYLPQIKAFYCRLGYLEHSSSDLFEQYLRMGVGSKPLIVGYENQIVEFSLEHKELWPKVKDKIRILYPVPTVWSSHPVIILKDEAKPLIPALQDKELLKIAWEKHGFRTGLIGVENSPKVLDVVGIPENVTQVSPMPTPKVMEKIIQAIDKR